MRGLIGIGLICYLSAAAAQAQMIPLRATTGVHPEEFTRVASVRELADGRLLAVDFKENRIALLDFRSRTATAVARRGDGPGEYVRVGKLNPLGHDSHLQVDDGRRWLILFGDKVVRTLGPYDSIVTNENFVGADNLGNALFTRWPSEARGRPDFTLLLRMARASGRTDTVERLSAFEKDGAPPAAAGTRGAPVKTLYHASIAASDQVAVFPDGWIAVARVNPYRVDWCPPLTAPRRACTAGPVLRARAPLMTDREKRAYLSWTAFPPTDRLEETTAWPTSIPPFIWSVGSPESALIPLPDGRLLVRRMPTADVLRNRYDVVDRRGARTGQIDLPLSEWIVGVGASSVYVVVTDATDLQRIRRHPWP